MRISKEDHENAEPFCVLKKSMGRYDQQKMALLVLNPEFEDHILQLRKKWHIPTGGFLDMDTFQKWNLELLETPGGEIFDTDFNKILSTFALTTHFKEKVYEYLMFNTLNEFPEVEKENVRFFFEKDKLNNDKQRLFFEIYADTTLKDIEEIWGFVKKVQESAVGYTTGRRTPKGKTVFERDAYIFSLSKQGKSARQIRDKLKKMPGCKVPSTEQGIATIISRMKRKAHNS